MSTLQQIHELLQSITPAEKAQVWHWLRTDSDEIFPGIYKTPGICGGRARAGQGRITVWGLVEAQRLGCSDAELLDAYPSLRAQDLESAWAYARIFADEIEHDIFENSEAEIERELADDVKVA